MIVHCSNKSIHRIIICLGIVTYVENLVLETDDVTSHIKSDVDLIREASELFGSFFGFEDDELASTIVKMGKNCASLSELKKRIHEVCFS